MIIMIIWQIILIFWGEEKTSLPSIILSDMYPQGKTDKLTRLSNSFEDKDRYFCLNFIEITFSYKEEKVSKK